MTASAEFLGELEILAPHGLGGLEDGRHDLVPLEADDASVALAHGLEDLVGRLQRLKRQDLIVAWVAPGVPLLDHLFFDLGHPLNPPYKLGLRSAAGFARSAVISGNPAHRRSGAASRVPGGKSPNP